MKKLLYLIIFFISVNVYPQDGYKIIQRNFSDSLPQYNLEAEIVYPKIEGYKDKNTEKSFNDLVYKKIFGSYDDFIANVKSIYKDFDSVSFFASFFVGDSILYKGQDFISASFWIRSNYGGAHGSTFLQTINFDLKTGREIQLKDIFTGRYIEYISGYCIDKLKKDLEEADESWIVSGAGPVDSNFVYFNITEKGLLITFQLYQVAAYVYGLPEIFINYSNLKKYIIKDDILINIIK